MNSWSSVAVLSIGGALGVNARYWLGVLAGRWAPPQFPWSTVLINVSGSFAIGFLAVALGHRWPDPQARLFAITGFLGGYTTFSTFAFESLALWESGAKGLAAANAVGSVAAGLVAVALGAALARATIPPYFAESSPGLEVPGVGGQAGDGQGQAEQGDRHRSTS